MIHTASEIIQRVFDESPHDSELKYLYEKAINVARREVIWEVVSEANIMYNAGKYDSHQLAWNIINKLK